MVTPKGEELILTPEQQKTFAGLIKECEVQKRNYEDTQKAFNECQEHMDEGTDWWQTPAAIASFVAWSLIGGFFIGKAQR